MIVWGVSTIAPTKPLLARGIFAYGICVADELSQLFHTPTLDAIRETTLGSLVLGSAFDPRDLAAYAVGVCAAVLLEWATLRCAGALRVR
jgi:hypothetical protein